MSAPPAAVAAVDAVRPPQDCEEDAVAGSARWPPPLCAPARLPGQPGLVAAAGGHRRVRTRGQRTRLADTGSPQVSGAADTASAAGSGADDRRMRSATRWAHLATTLPPGRMTGCSASCPLALVPPRKSCAGSMTGVGDLRRAIARRTAVHRRGGPGLRAGPRYAWSPGRPPADGAKLEPASGRWPYTLVDDGEAAW